MWLNRRQKVTRCRRVGDTFGSKGIEIGFVIASVFDVIKACPTGEQVKGNVEDVIRFVIGQVKF